MITDDISCDDISLVSDGPIEDFSDKIDDDDSHDDDDDDDDDDDKESNEDDDEAAAAIQVHLTSP